MSEKVFVAMSGGVDSSVAALLLKRQGYDVIGITMQIWPVENAQDKTCCGLDAINDARRVCWRLNIPHYVMNFRDEFTARVVDYFCREYVKGRTPNPCIACNRFIKFHSLLGKALAMGADFISTGHYAQVKHDQGKFCLYKAMDRRKDQSYALYNLTQDQLRHTLFPLGQLCKEEVRDLAREAGLVVAEKRDSQEICFVDKGGYAEFVENYLRLTPTKGAIIDAGGRMLGHHPGIHHYTIGQRKGLGIAAGSPVYVNSLDADSNVVCVGDKRDLFKKGLLASEVKYISGDPPGEDVPVMVKVRYSAPAVPASLMPLEAEQAKIHFETPQRAVAPGQAIVFYQGEKVLGGGTISKVIN